MNSAAPSSPEIQLLEPLPAQFTTGLGQYQVVQGKINTCGRVILGLSVVLPSRKECRVELFPGEDENTLDFVVSILWLPADVGQQHPLRVGLKLEGQPMLEVDLGSMEIIEAHKTDVLPGAIIGDQPLVAICMAMYEPSLERLARQIESILCQGYENWLLIISDDHSQNVNCPEIKALCNLDPRRIRLYQHRQRLGFYHNFERALGYVPDNAEFIAFADQDDEWYPEKLSRLLQALEAQAEANLVYSDMQIVSESGELLSNTYWQARNNEYRDFSTVFIANTVTGAASVFRRELLEYVLPFPARIGEAFHDHWIACAAMSRGRLAYVSEPLYDYIQYEDSVIGHCNFNVGLESATQGGDALPKSPDARGKWQEVYRNDCLRLKYIAETLKVRIPDQAKNHTLNLMNGWVGSAFKLLLSYVTGRLRGRTTNQAELVLMMGLLRGRGRPGQID